MANSFAPGNKAGLGRKPGSRNRLQGAFVSALAKDFEEFGEGVIRIVRIEEPTNYLRICVSVLPKEFIVSESELDVMNDDELAEALNIVRQARAARTAPPQ
jgi:hypothetical protein